VVGVALDRPVEGFAGGHVVDLDGDHPFDDLGVFDLDAVQWAITTGSLMIGNSARQSAVSIGRNTRRSVSRITGLGPGG